MVSKVIKKLVLFLLLLFSNYSYGQFFEGKLSYAISGHSHMDSNKLADAIDEFVLDTVNFYFIDSAMIVRGQNEELQSYIDFKKNEIYEYDLDDMKVYTSRCNSYKTGYLDTFMNSQCGFQKSELSDTLINGKRFSNQLNVTNCSSDQIIYDSSLPFLSANFDYMFRQCSNFKETDTLNHNFFNKVIAYRKATYLLGFMSIKVTFEAKLIKYERRALDLHEIELPAIRKKTRKKFLKHKDIYKLKKR